MIHFLITSFHHKRWIRFDYLGTQIWLEEVEGLQTFDEPIDGDIEKISRLLDIDPDDYPDTPPDTKGEV